MEFDVLTTSGTASGKIDLPDNVFNVKPSKHLMYEAVHSYLANKRQGTGSTKGRSEVRASGRKPWRQKGLGRARAGTAASPIWVGGGVAHGPKPRDYCYSLPQKARRQAIKSALSIKVQEGEVRVVESLGVSEPKTKMAIELMKSVGVHNRKCLFVLAEKNDNMIKATRNIPGVKTVVAKNVGIYDVLNSDAVVIAKDAVTVIAGVLGS